MAVIDGSTSKSPTRLKAGVGNGRLCMMEVAKFVNTMPATLSCADFCREITAHIASMYHRYGVDVGRLAANPAERATASAAIYSRHRGEVWLVGDCQCLTGGVHYTNEKPNERATAMKRALFLRSYMANHPDGAASLRRHDLGRDHIYDELVGNCRQQNVDFAVIDGFPIPLDKVKVVKAMGETVLATDGYPFLRGTLSESERRLQSLLAEDPLCIHRYMATKGCMEGYRSFDDRSYVRFTP